MATKQQAIDFLKSKYKVDDLGDDFFRLEFSLEEGRSQLVVVRFNDNWMIMGSAFATTEDMTPKQALEAASDWICGIQLVGETYFVRHVAPIADLDESEMQNGMELVLNIADSLEQKYLKTDDF